MGFGVFLFGVSCGLSLPFMVHKNISTAMSVCFLHPHMKYRKEKEGRDAKLALSTQQLDNYLLDVGRSTLMFFVMIGPLMYRTYYLKEEIDLGMKTGYEGMYKAEDSYVTMLKKMKEHEIANR